MKGWERHFGTSDFIEAMEELMKDNEYDAQLDMEIVEVYEGDSKNPPHVVIEMNEPRDRIQYNYDLWSESWWGWLVDLDGNEFYFEPYA